METIPRTRLSMSLLALTLLAGTLVAQEMPTISVNVKVVNVLATVRDHHGNIVNTLTQDDFVLEEDGRPQTIRYFARETDLPLSLGLLVDTSWSQAEILAQEKSASGVFANEMLREETDSAFLIHFDSEVEMLQDVTSSREKLVSALDLVEPPADDRRQRGGNTGGGYPGGGYPGGGYPGGGGGGYPGGRRGGGYPGGGYPGGGGRGGSHGGGSGGGTLLYDAVFLASDEVMAKQQGRKAIIVLTDGVDHGSKMSLDRAIESAQRADTMVYSIYFEGEEGGGRRRMGGIWGGGGGGWPGGGGRYPQPSGASSEDGKNVLERLSRETGGRMFVVSRKEPIDQIYRQIQDELRNQYNLGYTPDRAAGSGSEYRHIRVTTRRSDLIVQSRDGYYASRPIDGKPGQ
jgi:hypothetical protein